jgi:hypothetical protein
MPEDIEGAVAQPSFAPSDESATAWMTGSDQKAEQSGAQAPTAPAPKEQAPVPSAPTASQDLAAQIKEILKQELNPVQSELGQLRKVRSEFEKMRASQNQPTTPQSWASMKPEEQAQVLELVEHAWKQKYGSDWEAIQKERQETSQYRAVESVVNLAKELAGNQWDDLDPIMEKIYNGILEKSQSGDEKSRRIAWEVANTHSGVAYLVQLAKQELSQTVQATEQKATSQRQAQAKKAGTALNAAPSNAGSDADGLEALKNLPTDKLREYLLKHGAL